MFRIFEGCLNRIKTFQAHQNSLKSNFMIDSHVVHLDDILFIEIVNN